jgi:hypothetical protein
MALVMGKKVGGGRREITLPDAADLPSARSTR